MNFYRVDFMYSKYKKKIRIVFRRKIYFATNVSFCILAGSQFFI